MTYTLFFNFLNSGLKTLFPLHPKKILPQVLMGTGAYILQKRLENKFLPHTDTYSVNEDDIKLVAHYMDKAYITPFKAIVLIPVIYEVALRGTLQPSLIWGFQKAFNRSVPAKLMGVVTTSILAERATATDNELENLYYLGLNLGLGGLAVMNRNSLWAPLGYLIYSNALGYAKWQKQVYDWKIQQVKKVSEGQLKKILKHKIDRIQIAPKKSSEKNNISKYII